jgi:DNA-binding transcriptional MerR regulator
MLQGQKKFFRTMKIGELAEKAGVSAQAIRFYEREGLLPRAERSANGYRQYDPSAADRISFIGAAQAAGFTLSEIRHLPGIENCRQGVCGEMREELDRKIGLVDKQIATLRQARARLVKLRATCNASTSGSCGAVDALRGRGS